MAKYTFISIFSLLLFNTAFAQKKKDTAVYYLQTSGKIVSTKDSADFFLMILPPDPMINKKLFIVKEFHRNGVVAIIGNSKTNVLSKLQFEGASVIFYPNGQRMQVANYLNGQLSGDVMSYYPNGKLYTVKSYYPNKRPFLKQCNDSTGVVLAENGNGQWKEYAKGVFDGAYIEGNVVDGVEVGEWRGRRNDSITITREYKNGVVISFKAFDKSGKEIDEQTIKAVESPPAFPGGLDAFAKFLDSTLRYPGLAKREGIQGRVIVSFVIEKDGSVTDIKVVRGVGDGCDEEAVRVMRLSPHWTPGIQNGKPVRVAYTVPIAFTLSN